MATAAPQSPKNVSDQEVTIDRRRDDRREESASDTAVQPETAGEPRRKKQRRRHIDPTTCERDYSDQEVEFMRAMDDYKQSSGRMFPTCSEVLEVIRSLGYVQLNDDQFAELGLEESAEDEAVVDEEADEFASA